MERYDDDVDGCRGGQGRDAREIVDGGVAILVVTLAVLACAVAAYLFF